MVDLTTLPSVPASVDPASTPPDGREEQKLYRQMGRILTDLVAADSLAEKIDDAVRAGLLDARHPIAIARKEYGRTFTYFWREFVTKMERAADQAQGARGGHE